MARLEHDKEDLMREAVALRERIELAVHGEADFVTAGFRSTGALALYFGGDPVYQFDPEGRLRRAFVNGLLFRTQGHTLAELTRVRKDEATELQRRDLSDVELVEFLQQATSRIGRLRDALHNGTASERGTPIADEEGGASRPSAPGVPERAKLTSVRSQVPADLDLRPRLLTVIDQLLAGPIALAPAVPGRR